MPTSALRKASVETVRAQYEALPYPPRDPAQEKQGINITWIDRMDYLNGRFWGGAQDFKNFRVLVAGCGTGDAVMYIGEQLRSTGAEIIALDLSQASIDICTKRGAARKLENVRYVRGSLLELASLKLGEFDYINCCGVLHHLPNPDAGMKALTAALKPEGVMGIMLYGQHGRTGIYHMQELLRTMCSDADSIPTKIAFAKTLLARLPKTNWLHHNKHVFNNEVISHGDEAIYDLFLHSVDRAYTVPQVYEFVANVGLELAEFCPSGSSEQIVYNPENYVEDKALIARFQNMSAQERQATAELLSGELYRHAFYAQRPAKREVLNPADLNLIPGLIAGSPIYKHMGAIIKALPQIQQGAYGQIRMDGMPHPLNLRHMPHTAALLKALDGKRKTRDVLAAAAHTTGAKVADLMPSWQELWKDLDRVGQAHLRKPGSHLIENLYVQHNKKAADHANDR